MSLRTTHQLVLIDSSQRDATTLDTKETDHHLLGVRAVEAIQRLDKLLVQQIGVLVHSQAELFLSLFEALVVLGDLVLVLDVDLEPEALFGFAIVLFAVLQLKWRKGVESSLDYYLFQLKKYHVNCSYKILKIRTKAIQNIFATYFYFYQKI